jgi:hypothetical protein
MELPKGFMVRSTDRELPHVYGVLEQTAEKLGAAKARISTLEALTDQLAEAAGLIAEVGRRVRPNQMDPDDRVWDQCHPTVQEVRDAIQALRAYEADKEARS